MVSEATKDQKVLGVLTASRKSFKDYEGPVSLVILTMDKAQYITSNDTSRMEAAYAWTQANCADRSWVMWTPYLVTEAGEEFHHYSGHACVIFVEESDAALFVLAHNYGLMHCGNASKGDVVCANVF